MVDGEKEKFDQEMIWGLAERFYVEWALHDEKFRREWLKGLKNLQKAGGSNG